MVSITSDLPKVNRFYLLFVGRIGANTMIGGVDIVNRGEPGYTVPPVGPHAACVACRRGSPCLDGQTDVQRGAGIPRRFSEQFHARAGHEKATMLSRNEWLAVRKRA